MIPTALLARNFVRQNRWLLLAFVVWPFLLGAFLWSPHQATSRLDVAEIVQQEVFYGIAVVAYLASSAIYNEKRSRRIVGVLSKAVSRKQYLFGLLLGAACFALVYFAAVGASILWLLGHSESLARAALALLIRGAVASLWTASLALFFSTFLYPFIAAAIAGAVAFATVALNRTNIILAPLAVLLTGSDPLAGAIPFWAVVAALSESVIVLMLAAHIFVRRDVTVSVE